METKDKLYLKHYSNKKLRVSYHNSDGYEKVATGFLIEDTGAKIVIKTVMDEVVTLNYESVDNVIELKTNYKVSKGREEKNGQRRQNQ